MENPPTNPLAGFVLLSNVPDVSLESRSVVIVVQHSETAGSMGLCINHPLHLNLNDFDEKLWENFDHIPVFRGGPVNPRQIIITAMQWDESRQQLKWQLGLNPQQTSQLICNAPRTQFKAYCGHLGWGPGQLIEEIQKKLWLPVPMPSKKIFRTPNDTLWDTLMFQHYPDQHRFKELPKDPSLN